MLHRIPYYRLNVRVCTIDPRSSSPEPTPAVAGTSYCPWNVSVITGRSPRKLTNRHGGGEHWGWLPSRSVQVFQRATDTYIACSRRLGAVHYSTRPLLLFFLGVSAPVTFSKARHFGVYLFVYPRSILRRTISLEPFIYAGFRVLLRSCPRTEAPIGKRRWELSFCPLLS